LSTKVAANSYSSLTKVAANSSSSSTIVAANGQWLVLSIFCTCNGNNPTESIKELGKRSRLWSPRDVNLEQLTWLSRDRAEEIVEEEEEGRRQRRRSGGNTEKG